MKGRIGDVQRIAHIEEAIREIEGYIKDIGIEEFKSNSMIRFASVKQIEIIGEAASHITEETKSKFPGIAWRDIVGLRHILVHQYFGIDTELVWQIVTTDIPDLKGQLKGGSF